MHSEELTEILFCPERERCRELVLVLESQAIEAHIRYDGNGWVLSVPAAAASLARQQIEAYAVESRLASRAPPSLKASGRAWPGVGAYAAVIVGMALVAPSLGFGIDWLAAGRMDGGLVAAGEWWRTVTALTLHADAPHLLGNLVFGGFFGYSVARYLGGGFGWLLIVVCGALGNLANGYLSGADHRSIGASTAVFAALGVLSAYCWRRGFPAGTSRRERMAPVVAGLGLLAFTGTGGINTDLGAHLLGFVAGFGGGLVAARLGAPETPRAQLAAGMAAIAIVALAWIAAIA